MNKFLTKIVGAALGLTLAIGVGVAVGVNQGDSREVSAEEANTFITNASGKGTSGTGSSMTATSGGVSFTFTKGYGSGGTQIRSYGGQITLSWDESVTSVDSISMTVGDGKTGGTWTNATQSNGVVTWNSLAKGTQISHTSQARITALSVTYTPSGQGGGGGEEPTVIINDGKYTLAMAGNSTNSAYDTEYTITPNGLGWKVHANQSTANAWRVGGKNLNKTDRIFKTTDELPLAVASLSINHKGLSTNSLTVNSVTLVVASDSSFNNVIQSITKTDLGLEKDKTGSIVFYSSAIVWPENSYYKLAFNFTNSNNSNYAFILKDIVLDGSDKGVVNSFVYNKMHMTDYDPNLDNSQGTNACLGENGYYRTAKTSLTGLTDSQISLFQSDNDFNNPQARYEAWAVAYGDSTPYAKTVNASGVLVINNRGNNQTPILIIVLISSISLVAVSSYFVIRRRREN